jgi:hypothetical protein
MDIVAGDSSSSSSSSDEEQPQLTYSELYDAELGGVAVCAFELGAATGATHRNDGCSRNNRRRFVINRELDSLVEKGYSRAEIDRHRGDTPSSKAFDDAGVKFVRNSNKIDARVTEGGSQKTQVRQLEALCTATAVLANTDMGVLEREAAWRQMLFAVADGVDVDCSSDDEDGEVVGASNSDSGSDSESDVSSVGDDDDA